ncbi:MAG: ankyrin repeat domain-containing protein [Pelagibacterales bacterium]|nr:ankyrin repeat domain-containing protein [Pelagibacterales bacterium]
MKFLSIFIIISTLFASVPNDKLFEFITTGLEKEALSLQSELKLTKSEKNEHLIAYLGLCGLQKLNPLKVKKDKNIIDMNKGLKILCRMGVDLNIQFHSSENLSVLSYIIKLNNFEMVKTAIENGAIINNSIDKIYTPLLIAISLENIKIIEYLILNNATLDKKVDMNGKILTPLFLALSNENLEIIKLLLKNSVDVNIQDHNGDTPLIYSVNMRDYELVSLFLRYGANKRIRNKLGINAEMIAFNSNPPMPRILAKLSMSY